ncbi:hypothetical protein DRF59_17335 [Chryseobacterium flavum]|uniref:Uncharacterized protein n=1 Tax=Chryseobacterium flavum TaxID=415851 RepID=A0A3D9CHM0_9FLAO|nr:hypothetical protein [Chryseobacterium flavum]REC65214.1 hypothetical protein DRF59_17335 [Chryseobacterium flavum]
MYIKILLSLSLLACSGKEVNIANNTEIQNEAIQIQKKNDDGGFVILKNTYDHKIPVVLYNSNHSQWKSFSFNDNFNDEDIIPYAIKPDNTLLVFKNLGKENGYYKVLVNEDKNTIKYIKESDPNFKYQTIEEHILTVFSVEFNEKENPLRLEPDAKSKTLPLNKDSFYYPVKINGNWLMVEDDNNKKFWIKWRDEKGNLIIDLYYDA